MIRRLDQVRYIPVLHFATLWLFAVDSLRYEGRIKRGMKMLLTLAGCGYGTVLALILSVRDEVLMLNGI